MGVAGIVLGFFAWFAFVGIWIENRRQTDALHRIARAMENRNRTGDDN